ncbi:MAG: DUF805 domain-containing protein [Endomicrobium sp.]|jgi:uncharacterized membrane protein YhaH (DUF805 family)|nr:DUF805 domain-containing protein [Endomicrobium sp.]
MKWFKIYYLDVIMKCYSKFSGRATRKQFWFFMLINGVLVPIIFYSLLMLLGYFSTIVPEIGYIIFALYALIVIFYLFLIVPEIAITARRLHDIDLSGWWQLIVLIPLLGAIVLIIMLCLPSKSKTRFD